MQVKTAAGAAISEIEPSEHETILASLSQVNATDLGEVTIRAGLNAAGALVVLLNTMGGKFAVVSAAASIAIPFLLS